MGVEAGRDEEEVRREIIERGQDARGEGLTEVLAVVAGFERHIEDIAGAGLV